MARYKETDGQARKAGAGRWELRGGRGRVRADGCGRQRRAVVSAQVRRPHMSRMVLGLTCDSLSLSLSLSPSLSLSLSFSLSFTLSPSLCSDIYIYIALYVCVRRRGESGVH